MKHQTEKEQIEAWFASCGGETVIVRQDSHGKPIPPQVTVHDETKHLTYSADLEPTEGLTDRLKAALKEAKENPQSAQQKGE